MKRGLLNKKVGKKKKKVDLKLKLFNVQNGTRKKSLSCRKAVVKLSKSCVASRYKNKKKIHQGAVKMSLEIELVVKVEMPENWKGGSPSISNRSKS